MKNHLRIIVLAIVASLLAIGCRDEGAAPVTSVHRLGANKYVVTAPTLDAGEQPSFDYVDSTGAKRVVDEKATQPRTFTAVTKSDSTDTSSYCTKGIFVGTAGDVSVIGCGDTYDAGTAPVIKNVPSGSFVPGCFQRIMNATTASNILCLGGLG